MSTSTPTPERTRAASADLPDFCSLPVLFALLVVGALTVSLMWLAPGNDSALRGYCVAMLFVVWLAMLLTVALCKLRPWMQRLSGLWPYAAVWLLLVSTVLVSSTVVAWLDHAIGTGLTPPSLSGFVRDCGMATGLLGAGLLRYFYVVAQWQARLAAAAHAQVAALQARIRPHFLFNSMNTVAALVRVDPDAAERTVLNLAELFRAALGSDTSAVGTLGEELLLVDRYLEIESLRLGDRLHVERDVDVPAGLPLPCMLLQPLVENAIRYGIQPLREGGTIRLTGRRVDGGIELVVDNPLPESPAAGGTGHGLRSVRERVAYHFGARSRVDVVSGNGRFVVTIHLPETTSHARPDRR
ncbi:two-component system sensor histidine kinase AlgZ [Luteibacter rhizovicinus]|uniref:Two-component system sensor histidine kinase AlgZ n=1 Tax=Luteibacter rhizovicinus TaxID=242606 RepID=A0A4R3YNS3_9GAMM|nr:histidine kinase [Luteibacter rhizovicinus]TCV92804.1 two-component system sensor histidine kinase AlgZ [Luteibacter rhizovicinus]